MAVAFLSACASGWQGPRPPVAPAPSGPTDVAFISGLPVHSQWSYRGSAFLADAPTPIGRFLAVADRKGRVRFLDPNTGKSKAELKGKGGICRPLVWDSERLYVVSQHAGKTLQCFDLERGKPAWHRKYRQPPEAPIRSGAELWLPVGDTVYALDPRTGTPGRVVLAGPDIWLSPVQWGTGWAALGRYGTVAALEASGRTLWTVELDVSCSERPAAAGDSLCVVTTSGTVFCLAADGEVAWQRTLDSTALFEPTVGPTEICVGASSGNVWMLNRQDGSVQWQRTLGAPLSGRPLLHEDWVAAALRDGRMELLDRTNGVTLDTVAYESILPFAPVWAFGRLFVVDSERKLHALGTAP